MQNYQNPRCLKKSALPAFLGPLVFSSTVWAGNGANFVLYNHHTEKAGATAVMLMNDFARDENSQPYSAQMLMVERGVTDNMDQ
ncbi:MAG: hypothetical protein HY028_09675 [Gammaproteobacteria bacterium]|nr:hypothetical protein [Gammaproteobacteria bacterium]